MPKYITTAEHAKSIRTDIKAAIVAGSLPKGIKVSVRTRSFSGGSAIDVSVMALPAGFKLQNRARLAFEAKHPHAGYWDLPHECRERWTAEGAAILATLEGIVSKYHEDNSTDSGGDRCWNVNFYRSVDFDSDVTIADRAAAALEPTTEPAPVVEAPSAPVLVSGRGARRWAALAARRVG